MWKLKDSVYHSWESQSIITNIFYPVYLWNQAQQPATWDSQLTIDKTFWNFRSLNSLGLDEFLTNFKYNDIYG